MAYERFYEGRLTVDPPLPGDELPQLPADGALFDFFLHTFDSKGNFTGIECSRWVSTYECPAVLRALEGLARAHGCTLYADMTYRGVCGGDRGALVVDAHGRIRHSPHSGAVPVRQPVGLMRSTVRHAPQARTGRDRTAPPARGDSGRGGAPAVTS